MAIMLNMRSKVYENIFFSASQPPDSSTIPQIAGIAGRAQTGGRLDGRPARCGIAPVAVAAECGAAGPAATGERPMSGAETVFGVGGAGR